MSDTDFDDQTDEKLLVSTSEIISQIDAEISYLSYKDSSRGWSPWIILASFIGIITLFIPMWKSVELFSLQTWSWFISAWLFMDTIFPWFSIEGSWQYLLLFSATKTDLINRRPVFFILILRFLLLIIIIFLTSDAYSIFGYGKKLMSDTPFFLMGIYGLFTGRAIYLLWKTKSSDAVQINEEDIRSSDRLGWLKAIAYSIATLPIAINYALVGGGFPSLGKELSINFRAGVLLAILLYLLIWFIELLFLPPKIEQLLALRYEVIGNKIHSKIALEKIDIIVPNKFRRVATESKNNKTIKQNKKGLRIKLKSLFHKTTSKLDD